MVKYAVVPCIKDTDAPESTTLPVKFELISEFVVSSPWHPLNEVTDVAVLRLVVPSTPIMYNENNVTNKVNVISKIRLFLFLRLILFPLSCF
jgi:hypothetical protein